MLLLGHSLAALLDDRAHDTTFTALMGTGMRSEDTDDKRMPGVRVPPPALTSFSVCRDPRVIVRVSHPRRVPVA